MLTSEVQADQCWYWALAIPRRRILFCRVVRFNPSRSAAPPLPAIRPDAALKASIITEDSAWRNVEGAPKTTLVSDEVGSSETGISSSSPRERMTARSIKFANSLMFPFHGQLVSISIARLGMDFICLRICLDAFDTK